MVLSETKSALVIKFLNFIAYLQSEILIFLVFVSSGDVTFFSGDITKISGNMTQVLGDMASGEMTLGRLDRLPAFKILVWNSWAWDLVTEALFSPTQAGKFVLQF